MNTNLAFQSTGTIKCNLTFWLICLVVSIGIPVYATGSNQVNSIKNYYHNRTWVPTYLSKQYGGMICIEEVQLSLNETGSVQLKASMLLSIKPVFDLNYTIQVVGKSTDLVTCQDVGRKLKALVTETATGISCWSFVLVEDKLKPTVKCRDTTVLCTGSLADLDSIPGLISINDNCTPYQALRISHGDNINILNCSNDTFSILTRTWSAIDPWGRVGSCTQKISLLRPKLSDILFPKDTTIYCPSSNISPALVGQPTIQGKPLDKFCGWSVRYEDLVFNKCGISKKILRTWNILNCCSIKDTSVAQFILISDTTAPKITCRPPEVVSTSPDQCQAHYLLRPVLSVSDTCSVEGLITIIKIDDLSYGVPNTKVYLSTGSHTLNYVVTDPCGNKSSCNTSVTVKDKQKPTLLCPDSIQVSIPASSIRLAANDFTSVSAFDNCGLDGKSFRRTLDNCIDGIDDTQFRDTLSVCCADVFKPFDFVFLFTDINNNSDSCHVRVNVVDKIKPALNCQLDSVVLCNQTKPVLINPRLTLVDNCADSVKIKIDTLINSFNVCGIGQFKRRVTAVDPGNNRDTCFQTITVVNVDTLKPSHIELLHGTDTIKIVGCADSLRNPGQPGYLPPVVSTPTAGCHRVFISFVDTFRLTTGTSRCRIVKRTWRVGDSCLSLAPVKILNQIIIQDTTAFSPLAGPVLGKVNSITGIPLENVHVEGKNELQQAIYSQMTSKEGGFRYAEIQRLSTLSLIKEETSLLNGISTLDLLKIQRHISGTKILTNPLDLFAADINVDGAINVLDLLQLRKYILGVDEVVSSGLPWKFVRDDVFAMEQMHPGMIIPNEFDLTYPSSITEKFIGFRVGDINHDAEYNSHNQLESRQASTIFKTEIGPSDILISSEAVLTMHGIQMSLFNPAGWQGVQIESSINNMQYQINQTELRINWIGSNLNHILPGVPFLTVKGSHPKWLLQNGELKSEWYDQEYVAHPIQFVQLNNHGETGLRVYPNPVQDRLNIELKGLVGQSAWQVMDETGRIMLKGSWDTKSTLVTISTLALPSGMYILQSRQTDGTLHRERFIKTQ